MKYLLLLMISFNIQAACKPLKVCWEEYIPYQMKIGKDARGMDLDLMVAAANMMSCKIEFESVPWKRCLVGLEKGTYDAAATVAKSKEREAFAYFSDGYFATANVLFTQKENVTKYNFKSPKEILNQKHFILAIVRGFDYGEEMAELFKNPEFQKKIMETEAEEINFKHVAMGKVDGMYSDEVAGQFTINSMGLSDKVFPVKNKGKAEDAYYMFSKKTINKKFVDEFNVQLRKLKADGTYQKLIQEYVTSKKSK